MLKISDYWSIEEAAEFLGVTANTLRNWESAKKIKLFRNPINNYRMYRKEDLEAILQAIEEKRSRNDRETIAKFKRNLSAKGKAKDEVV